MTPISHAKSSLTELEKGEALRIRNELFTLRKVAVGGMGMVLLLEKDMSTADSGFSVHPPRIALKTLLPASRDAHSYSMFQRELTVWASFRHPNITWLNEILDGGSDGWIAAMDWRPGSLRDHLSAKGHLPLKESTDILGHILDGLSYAYDTDKVHHLDLKPENILYDWDIGLMMKYPDRSDSEKWRYMISDWGIASVKQPYLAHILSSFKNSNPVDTFNNMGTMLYMAPERFYEGNKSSIASDMFSLGMIYFELLTGSLPFSDGSHPVTQLAEGSFHSNAKRILRRHAIPPSISSLILNMMSFSPKQRPHSYSCLRKEVISAYRRANGFFGRIFG